ncbi:hypothetical protein UO65_5224 [Actinokineospora spheciospongiae]|uniref:Pilus assembly protein TadE n=1 Tax=Actinokineospora spheciospongiae TaxID=909613 RepID=W7ISU7_9PSEU|nr:MULTISPECIES: TadE family type IV pilus minor pilin [Actinokineospora]EWC59496.1 hypothetical protein UO65_5224 [Actinokineospora spheciospongiae]MCG8914749.1 pilus assembly protein [Actinokineospora sp. PR83]PWW65929.1 TadE-like protein [Actinokineospora spheciospongiae]
MADRGAVTVEAAVALGAIVLVLAFALGGISALSAQVRCVDAAREAARLAARGEPERGRAAAVAIAPPGAAVDIRRSGDEVTVVVHAAPVGGLLPGVDLTAEAYAVAEPEGVIP